MKKIKNLALIGLAALFPLSGNVKAQSYFDDERLKVEYNGDFNQNNSVKETAGFGTKGTYDGRTSARGQFVETGRIIAIEYPNQDNSVYMAGLRLDPQKITGLDFLPSQAIAFTSYSQLGKNSSQSIGSEMKWSLKDNEIYLRGEFQNGINSLSHIGGTIRHTIDELTFQIGDDYLSQNGKNFNQLFANISLSPTKSDFYAVSFAHQDLVDKSSNNRLRFSASHFGKDQSWGHRSFIEYSWNPIKDQRAISGQIGIVPFGPSTYSKVSAKLISEDTWDNDSSFDVVNTPFALYTETVPHYDRIIGGDGISGFGVLINGSLNRTKSLNTSSFSGQIHYVRRKTGSQIGQNEYGVFAGPRYLDNGKENSTYIDTGAIARIGRNFSIRSAISVPLVTESKQKIQGSLEAELKF